LGFVDDEGGDGRVVGESDAPRAVAGAAVLDAVLGTNVTGCFLALKQAIRRMATDLGGSGGAVVNGESVRENAVDALALSGES